MVVASENDDNRATARSGLRSPPIMIRDARTRLLTLSLPLLMETDLRGQVSNAWIPVRSGVDALLCDTRRRILLDHDQRQRCA